jgi:cytochrome c oxidase cbb3-type subunit 3
MSEPKEKDRLLEHRYDDIQEYDNPLPTWWTVILWVTVVWGMLYWFNFIPGIGSGKGRLASYEADMKQAAEKYGSAEQQASASIDVAAMVRAVADPQAVAAGRATFQSTCSPCHLADGGGSIGPNLTDDHWIHGNTYRDILTTITNGVPDKGMPTWSSVLTPEQVAEVAAYVTTLYGTKPATAKPAQGDVVGPPVPGAAAPAEGAAQK